MARRREIDILTGAEIRLLITTCSNRAPTGIRNRALLTITYRAALRINEALALRVRDIDVETGAVTVMHGKGDQRRVVGIEQGAVAVVARWITERKVLGLNGHQALFCTLPGEKRASKRVSDVYVRGLLRRLKQRAGIEKRVHAHGLRHARAVELEKAGERVTVIQKFLGHASLATTGAYLSHLSNREVVEATSGGDWTLDDEEMAPVSGDRRQVTVTVAREQRKTQRRKKQVKKHQGRRWYDPEVSDE